MEEAQGGMPALHSGSILSHSEKSGVRIGENGRKDLNLIAQSSGNEIPAENGGFCMSPGSLIL